MIETVSFSYPWTHVLCKWTSLLSTKVWLKSSVIVVLFTFMQSTTQPQRSMKTKVSISFLKRIVALRGVMMMALLFCTYISARKFILYSHSYRSEYELWWDMYMKVYIYFNAHFIHSPCMYFQISRK